MSQLGSVCLGDIHAASRRLRPFLSPTPVVHSAARGCWLKLENLQATGAYKVRGALNALVCQVERGDIRPVIAASAGNHGAGVAWAARQLGLSAHVVVPLDAPRTKIKRIRSLGAQVIRQGQNFDDSFVWATREAQRRGWRFLHAFDDPDVIAGQGTVALELMSMRPDVVLVPIGGGGLASGVSIALRETGTRVVGVQIHGVDAMASILRGGPSRIQPRPTVADGLKVCEPGQLTREICRGLDEVILVTECQVRRAMRSLAIQDGLRVEGAGAVAVAALRSGMGRRPVALVTGGNVDSAVVLDVMSTTVMSPEPRFGLRLQDATLSA